MTLFTIGSTQTSAQAFFGRLQAAGVTSLLDVRLDNVSQLAGFSKREDLRYFLKVIAEIDYRHELQLAPTRALLDTFRKHRDWPVYQRGFLALMTERRIEATVPLPVRACLLCSEASPAHCHRRLVAEYLQRHRSELEVVHL